MNKRDLIRDLINSLAHDEPMSKVMMMAQAVSFELYNNLFRIGSARNKEDTIIARIKTFHNIVTFLVFSVPTYLFHLEA